MTKLYYIKDNGQYRVWSDYDKDYGTFELLTEEEFKVLKRHPNLFRLVEETDDNT